MNYDKRQENIDVLVLLWHSTLDSSVTAGGIRRIIEFAKRIPENMHFWILDNPPTVFDVTSGRFTVHEYKLPSFVHYLLKQNFALGRVLEWIVASWKLFFNGSKILKQNKCQIIYVPTSDLLFLSLPAILLKLIYRKKVVCDLLNFEMPYGSVANFYREMRSMRYSVLRASLLSIGIKSQLLIIKSLLGRIDYIVTVSQYLVGLIKKQGARCPVIFTPSGIDHRFIDSISHGPISFEGVFVGRHNFAKGVFDLIEVWRKVVDRMPDSRLAMVGFCDTPTRRQIDDKLREYNLEKKIFIKGALSEEEKIKIIKSSKVFIHLGAMEPLVPVITVLEGLACGLPVVLCDQPSYREHPEIYHHKSFALVPPGDHDAAAGKIVSFIDINGSAKEDIACQAKEYAGRFDWEDISRIEYDAIKLVASGGNGAI